MDPSVLIALIVACASVASGAGSFISAIIIAKMTGSQKKRERQEDWARQDVVADKVDQVALTAAKNAGEAKSMLGTIHTLVNSNMTAAIQGQLDQTKTTLSLLQRIEVLNTQLGTKPRQNDELILETENRIKELEVLLDDRMRSPLPPRK